jgi:hypothetical protein
MAVRLGEKVGIRAKPPNQKETFKSKGCFVEAKVGAEPIEDRFGGDGVPVEQVDLCRRKFLKRGVVRLQKTRISQVFMKFPN